MNTAVGELRHSVIRVVRTSTTEMDRRHEQRYPEDVACRLVIAGQSYNARIVDLSEHGGQVRGGPTVPEGTRGSLTLTGFDAPLPFNVRAAADGQLHILFEVDAATAAKFRSVPERLTTRRAA